MRADQCLWSSAPSYAQVKFWVEEFKRGRTSKEDETRSGCPSDATDEEICNKVRGLVYSDRRVKVEDIANALHISRGSVSTILHDRLGMRTPTARWVPKFLSDEQMATSASVYSALLKRFRSKEDDFLSRLVAVDETWVHYYEPENKAQSRQCVGPGSPKPKKFKTQPSAGKVMATVFWDAQGVIMLDFLAKKSTITSAYYANLLDQLRTAIREKRRGKLSKGTLLQQDNARVHTCKIPMDAVERKGYELIPQPAYSPDLAPSDYFLFPNLEKDIRGRHFRSNEEVVAAVEEWVGDKDPGFFSSGLMALEHRWSVHHSRGQLHRKRRDRSHPEISLGLFFFIDSPSYHAENRILAFRGEKPCHIFKGCRKVFLKPTYPFSIFYSWVSHYSEDKTSARDKPRSGRPAEAVTPTMVANVEGFVTKDRSDIAGSS